MNSAKKFALLFPGQGAQFVGMCKDCYDRYPTFKHTLEEAEDLLKRNLSKIIFEGPEKTLAETKNCQLALYTMSIGLWRVVQELTNLKPAFTAGLSLGEYTALTAAEWLTFQDGILLVQKRAEEMNRSCENNKGTMAAIIGLDSDCIDAVVNDLKMNFQLNNHLSVANYNCPGQTIISGTVFAVEKAAEKLKEAGAKRVIPLDVHGAFHSPLMRDAEERLTPYISSTKFQTGFCPVFMNVSSEAVTDPNTIANNLIQQVSHSVRWEQSIRKMDDQSIDYFLCFGPGSTLEPMHKRIGIKSMTATIQSVEQIEKIDQIIHY